MFWGRLQSLGRTACGKHSIEGLIVGKEKLSFLLVGYTERFRRSGLPDKTSQNNYRQHIGDDLDKLYRYWSHALHLNRNTLCKTE